MLIYHRRLRMISEELFWKGGRVSHSWCKCVAGHGYGLKVMDGMHAGQKPGALVACRELLSTSRVRGEDTNDTRSHRLPLCATLGRAEPELVGKLNKNIRYYKIYYYYFKKYFLYLLLYRVVHRYCYGYFY